MLIGFTIFAFASIGGGKSKSKIKSVKAYFTPVRTNSGFAIRSGSTYKGSMVLKTERTANYISYNTLNTYKKGNSTFILPNKYRLQLAPNTSKSNMQFLNLKIKLCR